MFQQQIKLYFNIYLQIQKYTNIYITKRDYILTKYYFTWSTLFKIEHNFFPQSFYLKYRIHIFSPYFKRNQMLQKSMWYIFLFLSLLLCCRINKMILWIILVSLHTQHHRNRKIEKSVQYVIFSPVHLKI